MVSSAAVKEHALTALDVDLVGIANVERFEGAPEGCRPGDILPGARSVIVMALRLTMGAVQAVYRSHEDGLRHLQCIYGTHGYALTPNYHLKFAAYRMARFLEKRGALATPLPSGPGGGGTPFSHRHAAVAAGIGELGWSGLLVTPDYGPKVRLVSVITRAELEPDPLMRPASVCDPLGCGICTSMCPPGAISETDSVSFHIEGFAYEYSKIHKPKCRTSCEGMTREYLGLKDLPLPDDPTDAEIDGLVEQLDPAQRRAAILPIDRPTYLCGCCLAYCPLGNAEERVLRRGLSSSV